MLISVKAGKVSVMHRTWSQQLNHITQSPGDAHCVYLAYHWGLACCLTVYCVARVCANRVLWKIHTIRWSQELIKSSSKQTWALSIIHFRTGICTKFKHPFIIGMFIVNTNLVVVAVWILTSLDLLHSSLLYLQDKHNLKHVVL